MATLSGIVLRAQSGFFVVRTNEGDVTCRMRGRLKKERVRTDLAVIGDRVEIERTEGDAGVLSRVLPRRTRLSRLHPSSREHKPIEDVIVANLDRVLAVFSASTPPMNPRLVDRFLVVAEHAEIEPVLVLTKLDEADEAEVKARVRVYAEELGYRVVLTSARDGRGMGELRALLGEGISALVGPSGVGKSSLLNALSPGLALAVGEISDLLKKGKHTTRVAELHAFERGFIADTPGIRELEAFAIPERELARAFPDLRAFVDACQFGDCLHDREKGCAVRRALEEGRIRPERYDSYLRQLRGDDSRA